MVLNHASFLSNDWHGTLIDLKGISEGMARLVDAGTVSNVLRMHQHSHETFLVENRTLLDAILDLLNTRCCREQAKFWLTLATMVPLCSQLDTVVRDRMLGCATRTLEGIDGDPLLLCILIDAVAISCPSRAHWDRDRITISFEEILPDESFEAREEAIDNLARAEHARAIIVRHQRKLWRECDDYTELWHLRGVMFPNLLFGPDVERHLAWLNPGWIHTVANRLGELDQSVYKWGQSGGDLPQWSCKVSFESESTLANPKLREKRRFRSIGGTTTLFCWHARFGSQGRIHMRIDANVRVVEIGYIGLHLPI